MGEIEGRWGRARRLHLDVFGGVHVENRVGYQYIHWQKQEVKIEWESAYRVTKERERGRRDDELV